MSDAGDNHLSLFVIAAERHLKGAAIAVTHSFEKQLAIMPELFLGYTVTYAGLTLPTQAGSSFGSLWRSVDRRRAKHDAGNQYYALCILVSDYSTFDQILSSLAENPLWHTCHFLAVPVNMRRSALTQLGALEDVLSQSSWLSAITDGFVSGRWLPMTDKQEEKSLSEDITLVAEAPSQVIRYTVDVFFSFLGDSERISLAEWVSCRRLATKLREEGDEELRYGDFFFTVRTAAGEGKRQQLSSASSLWNKSCWTTIDMPGSVSLLQRLLIRHQAITHRQCVVIVLVHYPVVADGVTIQMLTDLSNKSPVVWLLSSTSSSMWSALFDLEGSAMSLENGDEAPELINRWLQSQIIGQEE